MEQTMYDAAFDSLIGKIQQLDEFLFDLNHGNANAILRQVAPAISHADDAIAQALDLFRPRVGDDGAFAE
jgi:hypothetical protein